MVMPSRSAAVTSASRTAGSVRSATTSSVVIAATTWSVLNVSWRLKMLCDSGVTRAVDVERGAARNAPSSIVKKMLASPARKDHVSSLFVTVATVCSTRGSSENRSSSRSITNGVVRASSASAMQMPGATSRTVNSTVATEGSVPQALPRAKAMRSSEEARACIPRTLTDSAAGSRCLDDGTVARGGAQAVPTPRARPHHH